MKRNLFVLTPFVVAMLAAATLSLAQPVMPRLNQPDGTVEAAEKNLVIETMADVVVRNYIFPETAVKMADAIQSRRQSHAYDSVTSAKAFADSLTADLQAVSHDKHLRVRYSHEPLPDRPPDAAPTPEEVKRFNRLQSVRNYGFERAERLPGNVGYLQIKSFEDDSPEARTAASSAMSFLANTDALIIDLRQNGGGMPEMVQFVSTYLFEPGHKVHLNDLYFRPADKTTEYWTLAEVPGRRYPEKDVFVLTSRRTFSAAEEFTYNLKNLKRATIVGETTGGGAHPVSVERLSDHFEIFVSTGRAINPITKTNWEGTGVQPDIAASEEEALKTAHREALNRLLVKASDPEDKERLQMALQHVESAGGPGPVIRKRVGG